MSQTLYRKYRPQNFDDVIGQEHIKMVLRQEIKNGKIAHAYLFTGPRGVGKTTMARLLAKAANCQNRQEGQSDPCDECQSCKEITAGNCLDLVEMDAASNRGINEIRELRERVRFAPNQFKYKIFIIDEVHMLTTEAFNALLKTLEEPPAHAIFILATTELHKLPDTIISRCQRFDFKRVDFKDIVKKLARMVEAEGLKADKDVLRSIAYYSEGHPRDAESLLAQVLPLADENGELKLEQLQAVLPATELDAILKFLESIAAGQPAEAITEINNLVEKGADLQNFLDECIDLIRKIILLKNNLGDLGLQLEPAMEDQLKTLTAKLELADWLRLAGLLTEAKRELDWYQIQQMPIEMAVLEFLQPQDEDDGRGGQGGGEPRGQNFQAPKTGGGATGGVSAGTGAGAARRAENEDAPSAGGAHGESTPAAEMPIEDDVEEIPVENTAEFLAVVEAQADLPAVASAKAGAEDGTLAPISETPVLTSLPAEKLEEIPGMVTKAQSPVISMYDIKNKWPQVMEIAGQANRALIALLQVAEILEIQGVIIKLGMPYKFYLDRLKDVKNQDIVSQALKQVFGADLKLELSHHPSAAKDSQAVKQAQAESQPTEVKNLLQAFGGEVVG